MTLWNIGKKALVRAADPERAKALVADTTDDETYLEASVEVVRVQGPEAILFIADASPKHETSRRTQHSAE
jgi:hypothetical protein